MAKSTTIGLNLDISAFRKSLSSAIAGAKSLAGIKPKIAIDVDDSEVKGAQAKIDGLSGTETVKIEVDDSSTKTTFASIKQSIGDAFAQAKGGDLSGLAGLGSIAAGAVPGLSLASEAIGKVGEVLGDTIEKGKNFEKALKSVAIQTGLSGEALKGLGNAAQGAFVQGVGESADEAVKILGSLRQTLGEKIPLDQLQNAAVRTNQVAQSLGVETPELVAKLSPLIKQYGISFDQALNLVSSGAQKGVGDIGGYLDAINEFTPNLKEAGFSAEQFQGLLAKAGEQGVKDFAKVGDGVKELQNRIKSGDLTTQLEGIGGATSKSLQEIAKLGQQGALSGAQVLQQSVAEIDKAFSSGQISEALRGQLLTTLGGSVAEDLGSEVYSKIFGAPIDTAAIKANAAQAGKLIDEGIPPPDLGRIFETIQTQVGRAFNFIYKTLIGPLVGPFMDAFKEIGELFGRVFGGEAGKASAVMDGLKIVLGAVAKVVGGVLVNAFRVLLTVFNIITTPIRAIVNGIGILVTKFMEASGAGKAVSGVFDALAYAAKYLYTFFGVLTDAVNNLFTAIQNWDLSGIQKSLSSFGSLTDDTTKRMNETAEATKAVTTETDKLATAQKAITPPKTIDPEAAKKAAEEIAKLRAELAQLNTEQAKARELAAADLIGDEAERARKRLEIETKFSVAALEQERKSLKSRGGVRQAEEAVINKKIELLREDAANKLREINGKAEADRAKAAEEAEKKVTEITNKLTEDRLAKLKEVFAAGGVGVASEIVKIQRSLIEAQLSSAVDAIVESTPAFKAGAAAISNQLLAGLINADEARKRTAELRQKITGELLALPADSADVYAVQIRNAYDKAAEDIGKGTQEITDAVQKAVKAGDVDGYVESLKGLGTVLGNADYATPFKDAADALEGLNEEQEKLIQLVKDGETSYQDAAARFAEIDAERQKQASATAAVFATAFQAVAQSQLEAAQKTIESLGELRARQQEIADEIVAVEARKNAALEELRAQNLASLAQYEAAAKVITDKADADTKALQAEQTANTAKQADAQSQALAQIGTAAGAAFAGLATGAASGGEALKAVVGDTVKSLLLLYTPSILALFSSIIPPPFGQIAGFAAVAGLQALLSAALAGFKDGGYTGNGGTSDIAGVVHGKEFVVNAKGTAQNRALLEHINKGGSLDTFASAAPVSEFQMMRAELSAIRQRLDSMPNGISGRQAVAVDVGFDTYLYERDRRRAAVRSLRG